METAPLKSFATWARTALIREVSARISVVLASQELRQEQPKAVAALEKAVKAAGGGDGGRDAVADRVAYIWFNRIIALRFMDANGYTGIGVVSPEHGREGGQPEILSDANRGNIDPDIVRAAIATTVTSLLNGTRRSPEPLGEAYALLLAEYCRHWNRSMPFMFESEGDYTELLIPANLLADDSVLARAVNVLTEKVCQDVEVIGWLYQFYISERKDEVFAGFKKNKKAGAAEIPAATQLFTPHWIVRYLVENSLGRLWLLNRPTSRLADQMGYYIAPVDPETDYLKIASPEELKVIDPACGSGHMLTYAFDLLYAIYEEEGYPPSDIPGLILANNLYGTEIDPRAGALAAFALTMKARARQRTFFSKQVEPNICVLEPISFSPTELDLLVSRGGNRADEEAFWNQFEQADIRGSLIRPVPDLTGRFRGRIIELGTGNDLLLGAVVDRANRVVLQADYLNRRYAAVVANPPYMGSGNMGSLLTAFVREEYFDYKQDLYACFVRRGIEMVLKGGAVATITGDTWMFIQSFEEFRQGTLREASFSSLIHVHDSGNLPSKFGANSAFVLTVGGDNATHAVFIRTSVPGVEPKRQQVEDALSTRTLSGNWFSVATSDYSLIPGAPIAYWLSGTMRAAFSGTVKRPDENFAKDPGGGALGAEVRIAKGITTGQNARYLRFWWEVSRAKAQFDRRSDDGIGGKRWVAADKGGDYRRWYGNNEYVIDWLNNGRPIVESPSSTPRNLATAFQRSLACSKISSSDVAFRYHPCGFVFTDAAISATSERLNLHVLASFLNSSTAQALLDAVAPTMNFEVGQIRSLPTPESLLDGDGLLVVHELIAVARDDWDSFETSWDFECSPLIASVEVVPSDTPQGIKLAHAMTRYSSTSTEIASQQRARETANNEFVATRFSLVGEVETDVPLHRVSLTRNAEFRYGPGKSLGQYAVLERADIASELVSYAVGCMFGRYSLDEPGLILADQGAALQDYLARVPTSSFIPDADNVIPFVDDGWFEDDIVERCRQFLRNVFGAETFEENLRFVEESLGVKTLRDYFITKAGKSKFYDDHVRRYRKRPIYWMFSSPKGSFNALVYMHRYTPSTVSTVLNEYLREFKAKLDASRQHHERLIAGGGTPREMAAAQKEADRLRKVLLELDEYEHDVLYPLATQQVQIDLDDGVKANYPKLGAALRKIPGLEASDE